MTAAVPRLSRHRAHHCQRLAYLIAGLAPRAYVHLSHVRAAGFSAEAQWVVVPATVRSAPALWKWPRIRGLLRGRSRG